MDIFGNWYWSVRYHRMMPSWDNLDGTNDADNISGGGGGDHLWAGAGSDSVDGGSGEDWIYAGHRHNSNVAAWGQDFVYGGSGNDHIDWSNSTDRVVIFGDDINNQQSGNDTIWGGSAGDTIYGGLGGDKIYAGAGNDTIYGDLVGKTAAQADTNYLFGEGGSDTIFGGAGTDVIYGGDGADFLHGGQGADIFGYNPGDSGSTWDRADVIYDFNASTNSFSIWDKLDFAVAGTESNFGHIKGHIDTSHNFTDKQDFDQAKAFAQNAMDHSPGVKYEFVTDGTNGWLFADTDRFHGIDTAIELKGVTDLHYLNIV